MDRNTLKELIYIGSWLALPVFGMSWYLICVFYKAKKKKLLVLASAVFLATCIFIYARFIEPSMMIVRRSDQTKIGLNVRVALIADMHLGVYNDETILEKAVEKINSENVDAVLIAGDFTYIPSDIKSDYEPLTKMNVPIYAILGNHDLEHPGPFVRDELESVLRGYGVNIINNEKVTLGDGLLVGLGDNWAGEDDVDYLDKVAKESGVPIAVLTHNPDTVNKYSAEFILNEKWVTLTGHTHCGQIRIPVLYKYAIPTEGQWYDGGYYDLGSGGNGSINKVYITCGIGEVGLPMRLFNPPVVDIIDL